MLLTWTSTKKMSQFWTEKDKRMFHHVPSCSIFYFLLSLNFCNSVAPSYFLWSIHLLHLQYMIVSPRLWEPHGRLGRSAQHGHLAGQQSVTKHVMSFSQGSLHIFGWMLWITNVNKIVMFFIFLDESFRNITLLLGWIWLRWTPLNFPGFQLRMAVPRALCLQSIRLKVNNTALDTDADGSPTPWKAHLTKNKKHNYWLACILKHELSILANSYIYI